MTFPAVSFCLLLCVLVAAAHDDHGERVVKRETVELNPGKCFSTKFKAREDFSYNITAEVPAGQDDCIGFSEGIFYKGECFRHTRDEYRYCAVPSSRGIKSKTDLCNFFDEIADDSIPSGKYEFSGAECFRIPDEVFYFAMKSKCTDPVSIEYTITIGDITESDKESCEETEDYSISGRMEVATIVMISVFVSVIGLVALCCLARFFYARMCS